MVYVDINNVDFQDKNNPYLVNVGISNRHLHLSQEHLEQLFGRGHQLTATKNLTQPGQFACDETVNIVGPKGMIEKVRILGPVRPETQVELAQTDARKLGIAAPLRNSGDVAGTPGCVLVGPMGYVILEYGVIVANTHIHLHTSQGEALGIKDKELVDVYLKGKKNAAFFDVMARVNPQFAEDLHLDTDEANAAQVENGQKALIVKKG